MSLFSFKIVIGKLQRTQKSNFENKKLEHPHWPLEITEYTFNWNKCLFHTMYSQNALIKKPQGVLKFGFGRDVPPWNLKVDYTNTSFSSQNNSFIYQLAQFLGQILNKITNLFQHFLKFWLRFGQIVKNRPFIYQILHFIRGHSYAKRLILLPMLAAHPHRVFCTKYHLGKKLYTFCYTSACFYTPVSVTASVQTFHFLSHCQLTDFACRACNKVIFKSCKETLCNRRMHFQQCNCVSYLLKVTT